VSSQLSSTHHQESLSSVDTFAKAVTWYSRFKLEQHDRELRWFSDPSITFGKVIERACLSSVPNTIASCSPIKNAQSKMSRHSHQRRVSKDALMIALNRLLDVEKRLCSCQNFEELHDLVAQTIRPIHGIGELTVYDIAHRIGRYRSLSPQTVYLHAGTKDGAKALGITGARASVPVKEFPKPFQKLQPELLENLLCVCRAALWKIKNARG